MRIFTAIRHSIDPKLYYGSLWSANFCPALRELGHEVIEAQVDLLPASRFMDIPGNFTRQEEEIRTRITEQIISEVRNEHKKSPINIFLCYFYNAHFDSAGFREIHKLGIPTVNFYCNSLYQFELVTAIAKEVNFSWHTEKNATESYLRIGANPVWVQMAADQKLCHPVPDDKRQPKACFMGQRYADRDRWLAKLITANIPLEIYGTNWGLQNSGGNEEMLPPSESFYLGRRQPKPGTLGAYLNAVLTNIEKQGIPRGIQRSARQLRYRDESRKLDTLLLPAIRGFAKDISHTFAGYDVILNLSNVWSDGRPGSRLIPHVRLRDFEAPMCRTCYLTGHTDEIEEFYEIGKEIDTYRTPEELIDKAKFYLAHPGEAERLREAGCRRAVKDHTWKERFKTLFKKIGIEKNR
ncbi:MAG: glycosyltransferase family 1 protein [Candidatus Omnitrophica bacterium]|nr:glycosyltransferase family 1 protein [Candidatus Omnitrophota bacterium]